MENEQSLCLTCSKCVLIEKFYRDDGRYRIICPYYNKVGGYSKNYDTSFYKVTHCKGYSKKRAKK